MVNFKATSLILKMMIKMQTKFVLIGGLLILLALTLPMIYTAFAPSPASDTASYMVVTVTYTDGTTRQFSSSGAPSGLTIVDPSTGKIVSSIKVELYMVPVWTPEWLGVASYTVSGKLKMRILRSSDNYVCYDSGLVDLQPLKPLPTLVNGQPVVITSATVSASAIESLYTGWQNGAKYKFEYSNPTPITLTVTFTDGGTASRTATAPTLQWEFQYLSSGTLSSLAFTFYVTPLSILWTETAIVPFQWLLGIIGGLTATYGLITKKGR